MPSDDFVEDTFQLPRGTHLMGVRLSLDTADWDGDTRLLLSNPNVYFGRTQGTYQKGEEAIRIDNLLAGRFTKFSLDGLVEVNHHRTRSGAVLIHVIARPADDCKCFDWLLMEYRGDAKKFAWCSCHETMVQVRSPAQILCLGHRVLQEIRKGIRTTDVRL